MKAIPTKTDGRDSLSAGEFNPNQDELENSVSDAGIVLNQDDTKQLGQAISRYASGGADYFQDSGAVNAYILIGVGPFIRSADYFEGMTVRFYAGNSNTGPSTINVANIALVNIKLTNGNALSGGELISGALVIATYHAVANEFRLNPVANFSAPPALGSVAPNTVRGSSLQGATGGVITEFSIDGTLGGNSLIAVPVERAVKTYVDAKTAQAGKVLQVVSQSYNNLIASNLIIPRDDTIPQSNEGTEIMALAITPLSSLSTLIIEVVALIYAQSAGDNQASPTIALFGTSANALAAENMSGQRAVIGTMSMKHLIASASVQARTYRVRMGREVGDQLVHFNGLGSGRLFGTTPKSIITITEVI